MYLIFINIQLVETCLTLIGSTHTPSECEFEPYICYKDN